MQFGVFDNPASTPEELFGRKKPEMNLSQDEIFNHASGMGQNPIRQSGLKQHPNQPQLIATTETIGRDTASNASVGGEKVDFFKGSGMTNIFLETSKEQDERIRLNSPYGNLRTWKLLKVIVKSNDDIRQEAFAMQMISSMDQIFKEAKSPLWLKPYEIIATGPRCGLIEVVSDAMSIHAIKEKRLE